MRQPSALQQVTGQPGSGTDLHARRGSVTGTALSFPHAIAWQGVGMNLPFC
jgi:hypothetical protein